MLKGDARSLLSSLCFDDSFLGKRIQVLEQFGEAIELELAAADAAVAKGVAGAEAMAPAPEENAARESEERP